MAPVLIAVGVIVAGVIGAGMMLSSGNGGLRASGAPSGAASEPAATGPSASIPDDQLDEMAVDLPSPEQGDVPAQDESPAVSGQLVMGEPSDVGSQTIGTAGGELAAGGFKISVPADALSGDTTFNVMSAPITGNDFGNLITPLTPLYTVDDRRCRAGRAGHGHDAGHDPRRRDGDGLLLRRRHPHAHADGPDLE